MEENEVLIDITIEADDALRRNVELKEQIRNLKAEQKELVKSQKDVTTATEAGAAQVVQNEAKLKALNTQYAANGRVLAQVAGNTTEVAGSYAALNQKSAEAAARAKDLAVAYGSNSVQAKEAAKEAKGLRDQLVEVDKSVGQSQRVIGEYERGIGGIGQKMGALPGPVGAAANSIMGMTKAALAFIATPLGAVIAAIGAAVGALTAYFKGSEEGQNQLAKITGVLTSVLGNLGDVVQKVGKFIFDAFTNPKEALKSFGELIKEQITNRIDGMLELFPALGKAISLVFKGKFKEAGTVAANAMGKVTLGVDNVVGKIGDATNALKEFGKEVEADARLAAKVANMRAQADVKERKLIEDRAKMEAKIAELRLKSREKDKYTAEERMKFIEEAGALQDGLADKERAVVALRYEALKLENTLSNTTKEGLMAESQAKAALFQSDLKRDKAQKAMLEERKKITNEIKKAEVDAEKKKQAELDLIQKKAQEKAEEVRMAAEAKRIEDEEIELERKKAQMSIEAQAEYDLKKASFDSQFELERFEEQRRYEAQIAAAEKVGADTTAITEMYEKTKTEIKRRETENAIALASGFAGNIATIFGKNTKVGKMAASAQIAIDTYKGAMAAYTSLAGIPVVGIPLGLAAAASVGVTGSKAIKDVWAVKSGLPGDGGGGGSTPRLSTSGRASSTAAAVAGGIVQRGSGATSQQATQQAVSNALAKQPQQQVLILPHLTDAVNRQVQLQSSNSL